MRGFDTRLVQGRRLVPFEFGTSTLGTTGGLVTLYSEHEPLAAYTLVCILSLGRDALVERTRNYDGLNFLHITSTQWV